MMGFSFSKWNLFNTPGDLSSPNGAHKSQFVSSSQAITKLQLGDSVSAKHYLDLQLGSTFRNLSFGRIGTYFKSCGILRKYVLQNSSQSKELKGNLPG